MKKIISIAPGDGIGPEVMDVAKNVLDAVAEKFGHEFEYVDILVGGASIDILGEPMADSELEKIFKTDALLFGSVGGTKWDNIDPSIRPEKGILKMRKELGVFANLRPAVVYPELADASPLKREFVEGADVLVVRELLSGIYFGEKYTNESHVEGHLPNSAWDKMEYSRSEIKRIAHIAFQTAMKRNKRVCSVDKANVLAVSRFWRKVVIEVAKEYPEVELTHMYVDNAAMQLFYPKQFDVILTGNMFGDILSDAASMMTGSIGMLPSASLGGKVAYYEPSGGSAPDIAGQDIANPIAQILSAAMMLQYSFDMKDEAKAIDDAIKSVLADGYRTGDIKTKDTEKNMIVGCSEIGQLIVDRI